MFLCFIGLHKYKLYGGETTYRRYCLRCGRDRRNRYASYRVVKIRKKYGVD
jgi:hypothetical protein